MLAGTMLDGGGLSAHQWDLCIEAACCVQNWRIQSEDKYVYEIERDGQVRYLRVAEMLDGCLGCEGRHTPHGPCAAYATTIRELVRWLA